MQRGYITLRILSMSYDFQDEKCVNQLGQRSSLMHESFVDKTRISFANFNPVFILSFQAFAIIDESL